VTLLSGNATGQVTRSVIVGDGSEGPDTQISQISQVTAAASTGALVFSVVMSLL
jgi:hypothetical protein